MANEDVVQEIEEEIKKAKGEPEDFEIEITEDPAEEAKDVAEEKAAEQEDNYGPKVQKRIKKLVDQRREAELETRRIQEQNAQLEARLSRLEQGSVKSNEQAFNQRYAQTKAALTKAVEEGDTEAQVNFQEQMADMRAAMRIADLQKQQRAKRAASPTVGRAQQVAQNQAPKTDMDWWEQNRWFTYDGVERETAATRSTNDKLDNDRYYKDA